MKQKPAPLLQLCLFSNEQMTAMVEDPGPVKSADPIPADPAQLQWQLEIAQSLTGAAGRQHRKKFSQKRKQLFQTKIKQI